MSKLLEEKIIYWQVKLFDMEREESLVLDKAFRPLKILGFQTLVKQGCFLDRGTVRSEIEQILC